MIKLADKGTLASHLPRTVDTYEYTIAQGTSALGFRTNQSFASIERALIASGIGMINSARGGFHHISRPHRLTPRAPLAQITQLVTEPWTKAATMADMFQDARRIFNSAPLSLRGPEITDEAFDSVVRSASEVRTYKGHVLSMVIAKDITEEHHQLWVLRNISRSRARRYKPAATRCPRSQEGRQPQPRVGVRLLPRLLVHLLDSPAHLARHPHSISLHPPREPDHDPRLFLQGRSTLSRRRIPVSFPRRCGRRAGDTRLLPGRHLPLQLEESHVSRLG